VQQQGNDSGREPAASVEALFADALRHHQMGQYPRAERLYRDVLAVDPHHFPSLHHLGILALQAGRPDLAKDELGRAIALNAQSAECCYHLGLACAMLGDMEGTVTHNSRAIAAKPDYAEAHLNLGNALKSLGKLSEAVPCYERVLALRPHAPEAHYNLANVLNEQADYERAIDHYRRAIALRADYAEAHNNLGTALAAVGDVNGAITHYSRARTLRPRLIETYGNVAKVLFAEGDARGALETLGQALAIEETGSIKSQFVLSVKDVRTALPGDHLRNLVVRALSEAWGRPSHLEPFGTALIKASSAIAAMIEQAGAIWPERLTDPTLFAAPTMSQIARDRLLISLLELTPVTDVAYERFLTGARLALLDMALKTDTASSVDPDVLIFCCALARQCFVNEYVFDQLVDEEREAGRLRGVLIAAVEAQAPVPALWMAAVASYDPLHTLDCAGKLLARPWPEPVAGLVQQQVREPEQERRIRSSIPALTAIDDDVSREVRSQYEDNPYPRWAGRAPVMPPVPFDHYVRNLFPLAPFRPFGRSDLDYLIAGSGTGRHPIAVAQLHRDATILAVDLSLASLSYAKRKTQELGLRNLDYAHADILQLGTIERSFDVIDSTGVLHHMADPWKGWRVLLTRLRPHGCMRIGLYSASARRDVQTTMAYAAERGYGRTVQDIRRCRQELVDFPAGTPQNNVTLTPDFYSTSDCRDWLFHVQQQGMTIPQLKAFLGENDLEFLGFELDGRTTRRYATRFPADKARTDLDAWHVFETENPYVFADMYIFLVQRRG